MKKTYFAPEMEVVNIVMQNTLLNASAIVDTSGDNPQEKETDPDYSLFD